MAKKNNTAKKYVIEVENKPNYCGEGAGGAQFAHGKAVIDNERLADWFNAHKGYIVTEVKDAEEAAE